MIITFVGHGNMHINTQLSEKIRDTIISNVRMQDSVSFYCGGYGDFDNHCATLARSLKSKFQNCEVVFITPYLTPSQQNKMKFLLDQKLYDSTIYPPIENALPRFAITKRNQWIVEQADLIIAYVDREYGGAYKTLAQQHTTEAIKSPENKLLTKTQKTVQDSFLNSVRFLLSYSVVCDFSFKGITLWHRGLSLC